MGLVIDVVAVFSSSKVANLLLGGGSGNFLIRPFLYCYLNVFLGRLPGARDSVSYLVSLNKHPPAVLYHSESASIPCP